MLVFVHRIRLSLVCMLGRNCQMYPFGEMRERCENGVKRITQWCNQLAQASPLRAHCEEDCSGRTSVSFRQPRVQSTQQNQKLLHNYPKICWIFGSEPNFGPVPTVDGVCALESEQIFLKHSAQFRFREYFAQRTEEFPQRTVESF